MTKINLNKIALLSATSLLFSTAAHAQVADTWDIQDAVSVTAQNTGTVTVDTAGGTTAGVQEANIGDGYKNSISAAAVGASASSSFNTFVNDGTTTDTSTLTTAGGLTVTAGNLGAVTNSSDSLIDTAAGATIGAGSGNSISFAAVGSSASNSISVGVAGGSTIDSASFITGDAIIVQSGDGATAPDSTTIGDTGGNLADVTVGMATSLTTPDIVGGQGNSISVAGVGSSASFSISASQADKSTLSTYDVEVGAVTVTSSNAQGTAGTNPGVTNTTTAIDGGKIEDGDSNSISAAAVGSSASVSVSNTFFQGPSGDAGGTITDGTVSFGDVITASSFNSAVVSNTTDLGSATTGGVSISAGAGSNSSNNSISVASVGSSSSASFSVTSYDGASASGVATTAQGITLASTNTGNVLTTAGMLTPSIEGGYNNAISAAAVGASASQSVSHVSLPVN